MAPLLLLQKECGPKCKSRKHVEEIISLIIRCSPVQFKAYSYLCHNWSHNVDTKGRSALHIAASSGKTDILQWLLEDVKMDIGARDLESGYTALHRALLYGQLSAARLLIQHNSDLYIHDNEGLNPLDIAVLSRPPIVKYCLTEPNEVYTWGENYNNVLGHASSTKRNHPEVIDVFRKHGITVKQVVLCKYHSVFLSHAGQVYTCGHGQGGRLGHCNQQTVLVPKLLEAVKDETCLEIAAATDHTMLRMEGGVLYTFGINSSHQLGQTPFVESSFSPKQVNVKTLKGRTITGICVGRFHSVVCTSDSLYTVGLNAGQLGHLKGEKYVSQLKLVSSLRHTDIGISKVACSDAATVCLTTKGDLLVLHEYQCRKILSRWQEFEQVLVTGGNLDHSTGIDILNEKGGTDLYVYMRNDGGQVFKWQSNNPSLKRCHFSSKRQPKVSDMVVTNVNLLMTTQSGEAFMGIPCDKRGSGNDESHKEIIRERDLGQLSKVQEAVLMDEIQEFSIKRVLGVHRAVKVAADRKGRNFAVIQALPNGCLSEIPSVGSSEMIQNFKQLLLDSDSSDSVHDAVIQIEDRVWPVHRYVVAIRSDHCRSAVAKSTSPRNNGKLVIKVDGVSPMEMEQIIQYMYTDTCDFLTSEKTVVQRFSRGWVGVGSAFPMHVYHSDIHHEDGVVPFYVCLQKPLMCHQIGHKIKKDKNAPLQKGYKQENKMNKEREEIGKGMSAFQVEQKRKEMKGSKTDNSKTKVTQTSHQNPIKSLQEAARRLGVKGLSKRLDAVKHMDGAVAFNDKCLVKPKIKFERLKLPELHDVTIATEDGKEIQCHKCVLICRLEYFYSMLARGWVESVTTSSLTLPVHSDVLEILIDFLYTDEALPLRDCANEELLCNVLVVADQLLAWRLKEMCEVALTNIISLKNVSDFLEFATIYNAEQLKLACQEFVCLNITALLESRGLDICSDDTMQELTEYYRSVTPKVRYRVMTPPDEGPSQTYLDELTAEYENHDTGESSHLHDMSKKGRQAKKRPKTRNRSISEDVPKPVSGLLADADVDKDVPAIGVKGSSHKPNQELLAVVQNLALKIEGDEKKLTAMSAKQEKSRWQQLNRIETSFPIAPTQPEDVPVWSSNLKPLSWASKTVNNNNLNVQGRRLSDNTDLTASENGDSCPSSPTSPSVLATSPTSLRDIIMEESQSEPARKSSFSSRFSWKGVKKRQARESQERQHRHLSGEGKEIEEVKPASKVAANPWAAVGKVVSSFRDLMLQEEDHSHSASVPTSQTQFKNGQDNGMAAGNNLRRTSLTKSSPIPCPASPPKSDNPWQRRAEAAASPSTDSVVARTLDFSAIVQDEMDKAETLSKATNKPLALIQLEEQAMLELLHHYNASNRSDVTITVERVSKAMAIPLWHHEKDHVGSL